MFLGPGFGDTDRQMKPALHVQIIRTSWTKKSRGGNGARARAGVPLAFAVAPRILGSGQLSVEAYNFGEPNFSRPQSHKTEILELSESLHFESGAFKLNWNGEDAFTDWRWSWYNVGAPEPQITDGRRGRLEVAPNAWVRVRWHGRFSDRDQGDWHYRQTVVNVARCDADLNANFSGEPARCFEWLPSLW